MKYETLKSKSWFFCLFLSFLIIFSSVSASAAVTYCSSSAFGYGSSADGGGSATPVLVSSVSELQSALNKGKNKVIIITQNLTFTKMMSVQDGSNVTLLGLPGVTLTSLQQDKSNSGILYVKRFNNLIIRNLTFVGPGAYDCDGNDLLCFQDVKNAWVDHCDFQDGCDGNFDNKNGTDNVTISWCRFRYLKTPKPDGPGGSDDHRYTNLLGSSSSDKPSDGTYNLTWAYCWWDEGCKERMLRCRNASLHFLNCYWNSSVANYYIGPENADCYIEGCTFEGAPKTAKIFYQNYGGSNGAKFINCTAAKGLPSNVSNRTVVTPGYSYTALTAAEAKTAVTNTTCGAGATLTVTTSGVVSSTCDGSAPAMVTVTWDAATNGGTCSPASSLVVSGSALGSLPVATRSGYTFDGWFTDATGGTQITAATTVSSNTKYYAQFTEESGSGGGGGECTYTFAFAYATDATTAGVTNNTGAFTGFATGSNNCTGSITIDGTTYNVTKRASNSSSLSISITVPSGKEGTLYGLANSNGSTVRTLTLSDGGSYSKTQSSSNSGSSAVAITYTEMPAGSYTLTTDGSASVPFLCLKLCDAGSTPTPPTLVLSYDENGGSGTMEDDEQTGANVTVKANGFTAPTGYAFKEWNTDMNGSGTVYTDGQVLTLTEDLTIYAIWQPNTYTVTLNAAGGTGGSPSVTATFDEALPNITVPTQSGYVFKGYYTEADGAGTQYYDENGSSTNNWTTAAATTLYAYWVAGSTPDPTGCDLHFWFIKADDAAANGKTNDGTVFSGMVGNSSGLEGNLTIDGKSYSVTGRSGDNATFGSFTIPSGKTGVFYALAVSSGSGDRQINLVCGPNTYELPVAGGSTSYKRIESEELPEGTYSIQREGSSNVRLGVVAVKICDAAVGTKTVYLDPHISDWKQGNERYAVYYFESANTSNEGWVDMSATGSSECLEMYQAEIPAGYDVCIFCRMNGSTTENNWTNRLNQTNDLTVADGMYCTITSAGGGDVKAGCNWNNTPFKVCVTGTWLRFVGETISLNATCEGATNFQWYKGGTAESNKIDGATSATFTKTGCAIEDGDYYYCKAWAVAGSEVTSGAWGVKVPYLEYQTPGVGTDNKKVMLTRVSESAEVATCTVYPGVAWGYEFTISDFAERYGNSGTMDRTHTGWNMDKINSNWCKWNTDKEGTYTFTVTFSNTAFTSYNVTITYPPFKQIKDIPIYMEKTAGWSSLYYRIGKGKYSDGDDKNWTSAQMMTLVPGTDRFYQTKTPDWDEDFWAWHIGNNKGDENGNYSIYKTYSTGYEITKSTVFSGDEVTGDGMTIYLGTSHKGEDSGVNDNCDFYTYTHTAGMLTHDVSVGATTHGQLRINWTNVNNVAQESLGTSARAINDLAHTCILTITAEPDCGYKIKTLQVNGVDFTSGSKHILDANATIEATFEDDTYSVTLNSNGGTINSGDVTTYTHGVGATLPTDISYTGMDFTGWYDNPGCTGSPVTAITTTDCGNKEYWANWVAGKPEPVFTWDYASTVNAGGIYPISVSSTGDANVTIEIVETITGVSGSFTAGNPATGTLTLGNYPAAATFTFRASSPETSAFKAKSETQTVTIVRCVKSDIVSYAEDITNAGDGAKPKYYCETSGVGRITKGKGSSSISTSSSTYTGESWATKYCGNSDHSIQTYQESVFKIVLYVKSGSSATTMNTLRYSDNYIGSDGDGTDILSTSQIIYNDNPGQTHITQNTFETVTIIPPTPMNKNGFIYFKFSSSINLWGAKLYSAGGDVVTSVAFSGEPEVEKYPGEAPFIKTATQTTTPIPSGGSITYKSSDESVATVNPTTGEVAVLAPGRTTITAKLSAFGCFKEATATYSVVVKNCGDPKCTIAVTSGSARKCASESVTLTATAAAGAAIQWYKDGAAIPGETGSTLTTTAAGEYYATATKVCLQVSNTIEVENLAAPTAVALHEYYYIKAGRPRPAIPLFKLTNVKIDPSSFTMNHPAPADCSYELREDGIVYLVGTPSASLATSTYSLTVTTVNDCGFANASATLELRTLEPTAKKQIAWVAIGTHLDGSDVKPTKGETLPGNPDTDKSTSHALYTYLSGFFDMTAVNAYCTTDTKKISDYCSQFDLVLLTDYPDTNVKPDGASGGKEKSYSNAYGCLMDELPLLSFEAFVADCPNWGINSNPKTPAPTQKDMTLLCAAHSIFAGTTIDVNDKIGMLSSISGNGLQGFTGLDAPPGMLNIATIENNESNGGTLVVCCERQKIIEARMMIMGLNHNDMGNLTGDGKLVIKQIIDYLLQFEEMADCALVFDNGEGNSEFNPSTYTGTGTKGDGLWSTAANWHPAYNAVPKPLQAVRVDKPCQVDVTNAHCSSIRLRKDAVRGWNGNLTIHSDASLTVTDGIKEVRGKNYMTTYPSAASDLVIQASTSSQNGSLAFGNSEDELQATVEYYSLGTDATGAKPVWQYMGIPITNGPMAIDQYHAAWMCSWESEGNVSSNWVWVENEDRIVPFKGYCITQATSKKYIHVGALCAPDKKELPLHYFMSPDGNGFNMFANSWVAPIDIAKMKAEDFDGAAEPTIYIYNTGSREQYEGGGDPSTTGKNTGAGQFNAVPVNSAPYLSGALTKIPTMQGFFVKANKAGTLTLDYDRICFNSTDYTTTAETMRAPRRATKEAMEEQIVPEVMRVDVSSARFGDRVYILSHPEFSEAFDLGWDGTKQEGDENVPMLAYVQGNKLLAVAAIETPEGQYLSFRAGEDSIYTFTFDYEGETIYLYDRLADEAAEIRTGNTYTFRATNKTAAERFLITATPPRTPTQVETVGAEPRSEKAEKIIHENKLMILYHGAVYDAQGARVMIGKEGAR